MSEVILAGEAVERTPEEETLVMRLHVFNNMRWFAILGIIIVTVVAIYSFGVTFPSLPVFIVCAFIALYNLVLVGQVRGLDKLNEEQVIPRVRQYTYSHILIDLLSLTVLLHFTGGIENPFIFFFVFHVVLASIGLRYSRVYLLASIAMGLVLLLVFLEYSGAIPHVNLSGFAAPDLYRETHYVLAVLLALGLLLYGTTYVTSAVAGELRKRQREVVALRERLLAEKTGELARASDEIAKLEEERNRFLRFIGIAAHDLKAPLTAIQGFLWVMLGGFAGEISAKQKNMLERSTHRINELMNLISDLLDIPRIETGQLVDEMKDVSIRKVINDALESQKSLAAAKNIELKIDIPPGLPKIKGSAPRLQQVLVNLVNNAITYTPQGRIDIHVAERKKDLLVEIADTGIGIPPDDMPRLFEDFFRAGNVEVKGTGLGLSISRRIVEAHGGKIWVESPRPDTGSGTKFSFTLPRPKTTKRRTLK